MNKIETVISDAGRASSGIDEKRDCTVRATATALDIPYAEAHAKLKALGRKDKRAFAFLRAAKIWNWETRPDLSCRSLKKILPELAIGRFVVRVRGHVFAVVDGKISDLSEARPNETVLMVYQIK